MIVGGLLGFSIGGFVGNGLSELDQRRVARKIPNASEYRANRRAFDNLWILRNQLTAAMTFSEVFSGLGERSQGLPDNAIWKIYASEGKIAKLAERRIMERRQEKDPDRRPGKMKIYAVDRMTGIMEDRINKYIKVKEIEESSDRRVAAIAAGKES